jgi:hypothetical protein|tara:strand:+ start:278 stop:538 length:261 start_codon:yes stop_codon:yes gene_type:complete
MNDIDLIHAKNKLEILILKIENKYINGNIPEEAESSLKSLYLALNVMLKQDNYIQILKSEIISIKLQSIDAYKETARLKKEVKKIL